jgi:hypothetical protein
MNDVDAVLHRMAAAEGRRLFAHHEVIAAGGDDNMIRERRNAGRWQQPQVGVYLIGVGPMTWHEKVQAALMAVPDPAAASLRCALLEWGLEGISSAPVEITVPHSTVVHVRGAIVHRSRCPEGFVTLGDITVTSVERTLMESPLVVPSTVVEKAFTSAWRKGLTSPTKCAAYLEEYGSRGRKGSVVLRRLVSLYLDGGRAPGSYAETLTIGLLRPELARYGIEDPVRQFSVELPDGTSAVLDLAWPRRRKAIEPDGMQGHGFAHAQANDFRRRGLLREVGWDVQPVSPFALRETPRETMAMLIRFLLGPGLALVG